MAVNDQIYWHYVGAQERQEEKEKGKRQRENDKLQFEDLGKLEHLVDSASWRRRSDMASRWRRSGGNSVFAAVKEQGDLLLFVFVVMTMLKGRFNTATALNSTLYRRTYAIVS